LDAGCQEQAVADFDLLHQLDGPKLCFKQIRVQKLRNQTVKIKENTTETHNKENLTHFLQVVDGG
jgi:hypothetical protein